MSVFLKLPVVIPSPTAFVPSGSIRPIGTDTLALLEVTATNHWVFNKGDSGNLTDDIASSVLTEQSTPAVHESNYLTIQTGNGKALQTSITDTADAVDTFFTVFRVGDLTDIAFVIGNLSVSPAVGGSFYVRNDESLTFNYRGSVGAPDVSVPISALDFDPDEWVFAAVARDFNGTTETLRLTIGGDVYTETATGVEYTPGTAPISLGNPAYGGGHANVPMDVAEFGYFDFALTADELTLLYLRRKAALAGLGITVR